MGNQITCPRGQEGPVALWTCFLICLCKSGGPGEHSETRVGRKTSQEAVSRPAPLPRWLRAPRSPACTPGLTPPPGYGPCVPWIHSRGPTKGFCPQACAELLSLPASGDGFHPASGMRPEGHTRKVPPRTGSQREGTCVVHGSLSRQKASGRPRHSGVLRAPVSGVHILGSTSDLLSGISVVEAQTAGPRSGDRDRALIEGTGEPE